MALKLPDYLRKAEKISTKNGWLWEIRGSGHLMVFNAEGSAVTSISLTHYDGAVRRKVESTLRKANCPGIK